MRVVIQRVDQASVSIAERVTARIGRGLLVFLAIEASDREEDIEWLSGKIARLRVFDDDQGVMNRSLEEAGGEILVVSQFTLFASTRKGNRPSHSRSAPGPVALPIYEAFLQRLAEDTGKRIQTGAFGARMAVELMNNGPVTILIDSKLRE